MWCITNQKKGTTTILIKPLRDRRNILPNLERRSVVAFVRNSFNLFWRLTSNQTESGTEVKINVSGTNFGTKEQSIYIVLLLICPAFHKVLVSVFLGPSMWPSLPTSLLHVDLVSFRFPGSFCEYDRNNQNISRFGIRSVF